MITDSKKKKKKKSGFYQITVFLDSYLPVFIKKCIIKVQKKYKII